MRLTSACRLIGCTQAVPCFRGKRDRNLGICRSLSMHSTFENLLANNAFREGQYWERKTYNVNDTVIVAGECGHEIFVILQGTVRVSGDIELDAGRSIQPGICDLEAGAVFGELGLFSEMPRTATVTAVTDCMLAVIDGNALLDFFESHTTTGYHVLLELLATTADRLDHTSRKLLRMLAWGLKSHKIESHL